jgi:hypothetical protein
MFFFQSATATLLLNPYRAVIAGILRARRKPNGGTAGPAWRTAPSHSWSGVHLFSIMS